MIKPFVVLLALVLSPCAQSERILGLLEIPVLHSQVNEGTLDRALGPVVLFSKPSDNSEIVAVVRDRKQLESREHGYEQISAGVYGYQRDSESRLWYKLRYSDNTKTRYGWLNHGSAGTYRLIYQIVDNGLTYFTHDWDRKIYRLPDITATTQSFPKLEEKANVRVADTTFRGDDLWFLVVLVQGSYCSGGGTEIIASGWVPAYAENDELTVWHYSRGC